jgi:hypothetical protein
MILLRQSECVAPRDDIVAGPREGVGARLDGFGSVESPNFDMRQPQRLFSTRARNHTGVPCGGGWGQVTEQVVIEPKKNKKKMAVKLSLVALLKLSLIASFSCVLFSTAL